MKKTDWWKDAIVYQIYIRSFKDSNGDGIGDIPGIIEKLDYLADLGVDVLWITPFYQSPMIDNGYDISDYYQVDPMYGKNEDLDRLISEANKRGMKILLDLVVNHCSYQHAWFQKAIEDPTSAERDYFVIKKQAERTNWRSIFGGSVWDPLPHSKQDEYYMHVFTKEQPDLNWENPHLRKQIYQMMRYWLDKGIAGFRVDAISYIKKNQSFPNFPADGPDGLSHVNYGSNNQPGIDLFFQEMRRETFDQYDCMTVGEATDVPFTDLHKYVGETGCFSMIFEFSYDNPSMPELGNWYDYQPWSVDEWKEKIYAAQKVISQIGWSPTHIENHDSPRAVNKFLKDEDISPVSIKMLATIYFFLRGTPFIFQGQELGMSNVNYPALEDYDDVSTHDHYQRAVKAGYSPAEALALIAPRSRDNARTPMQWTNENQAGFTTGEPWLRVNPNYSTINVADEVADEDSVFHYYKRMIRLRKSSAYKDVLGRGTFVPVLQDVTNLVAYERKNEKQTILLLNNFQSTDRSIALPSNFKLLLNNYAELTINSAQQLVLKPFQSVILALDQAAAHT